MIRDSVTSLALVKKLFVFGIVTSMLILPTTREVGAADAGANVPKGPYSAILVSANILSSATFPGSTNPVADVTAVVLANGTIRAYVYASGLGTVVADSTDGKTFTYKGSAFGGTNFRGQPRVIKLTDGTYVMYNASSDGFNCSTSQDGLTFTVRTEVCLSKSLFAGANTGLASPGVVRLDDGRYRAYFSGLPRAGTGPDPWNVFSATSADGLSWTAETGARTGAGTQITRSAEHPTVVRHSDGTFTMFYFDNGSMSANKSTGMGLYYATSTDGLVFSNENKLELVGLTSSFENSAGNDPEVFLDSSGRLLVYFGIGPAGVAAVELKQRSSGGSSTVTTTVPKNSTKTTSKVGGPCPKSGLRIKVGTKKLLCKNVNGRSSWVKG